MLSERLAEFLAVWAGIESDPREVIKHLHREPPIDFALWLEDDLRAAIEGGDLTVPVAENITDIGFDDEAHVERYLRQLWEMWFPQSPFPTRRPV